jgi:hypothetical protein
MPRIKANPDWGRITSQFSVIRLRNSTLSAKRFNNELINSFSKIAHQITWFTIRIVELASKMQKTPSFEGVFCELLKSYKLLRCVVDLARLAIGIADGKRVLTLSSLGRDSHGQQLAGVV